MTVPEGHPTALALAHRGVTAPEWALMLEQARVLTQTGFLPQHIKTPEQAVAIMLKARELNIPPLYGLSNIAVIQGKPACNAELMLALVYRDHGDGAVAIERSDESVCTIAYRRRNAPAVQRHSFTIEDAERAGLVASQNVNWKRYPAAMLRARCISAVARMAFPDSLGGMYVPDELGAAVAVDSEGVVSLAPTPAPVWRDPTTADPPTDPERELTGEELAEHFSPTPVAPASEQPRASAAPKRPARDPELDKARALARQIHAQIRAVNRSFDVAPPGPTADAFEVRSYIDTWQDDATKAFRAISEKRPQPTAAN